MIKLVLLVGLIYGVFWIDSPPGRVWRENVSVTFQEKGIRGMIEPIWCGERGCDPTPGSLGKDVSPDPANKSKR